MTENKIIRQEAREQVLQEVKRLNKYIEELAKELEVC